MIGKIFDLVPSWVYAVAVAALSVAFLWQGTRIAEERLQWANLQRDAAIASKKALEVAHAETVRMQGERDAAVREAEIRKQQKARDAAAVELEHDGLRNELAVLRAALSSDSRETCVARADAIAELFEVCVGKYRSLAEKAQGHLGDALMLDEAWPKGQ